MSSSGFVVGRVRGRGRLDRRLDLGGEVRRPGRDRPCRQQHRAVTRRRPDERLFEPMRPAADGFCGLLLVSLLPGGLCHVVRRELGKPDARDARDPLQGDARRDGRDRRGHAGTQQKRGGQRRGPAHDPVRSGAVCMCVACGSSGGVGSCVPRDSPWADAMGPRPAPSCPFRARKRSSQSLAARSGSTVRMRRLRGGKAIAEAASVARSRQVPVLRGLGHACHETQQFRLLRRRLRIEPGRLAHGPVDDPAEPLPAAPPRAVRKRPRVPATRR